MCHTLRSRKWLLLLPRLTSGAAAAAAGTAPGVMPPIGMRPTSWIFNVFCGTQEKFQWLVVLHNEGTRLVGPGI